MRWEHLFAFAKDGAIVRHDLISADLAGKSIQHYISQLGADGYEFAGSYPEDDGVVIVLKQQRTEM
jgi:hypothetical protein